MENAIKIFGKDIVTDVMEMVSLSDADGMYNQYLDMGMDIHAECVEYMYFK